MATTNLDATAVATNLEAVDYGGLINEDVMQKIWDISYIPLPFTDMIGTDSCDQAYKEWTVDALATPDVNNAAYDGQDDFTSVNQATLANAERLGNHCQESTKTVQVSTRARNSDTIGRSDELAYQIMMRQRELRRDVEAIMLTEQASVKDLGSDTNEGKSAGLFAWIRDGGQTLPGNALVGADTGDRPGFASSLVGAVTAGTTRALSETLVRDACELAYTDGGDPSKLMMIPTLCRKFSEYLFTSSARIASLYSDTGQAASEVTAKGSVNVFVTDFGITLDLMPNRIMQPEVATGGSTRTNAAILDPAYLSVGYLQGYTTDELAKTGLADKRLMHVDYTLIVKNLDAHATICDIDYEADVTA